MKKSIYIIDRKEGRFHIIYYSKKKEYVEDYRELIHREDLDIRKITKKQFEYYKGNSTNILDKLVKYDGIIAPEGEIDMISVQAETQMYDLVKVLKKLRKTLKIFRGKGAKKLRHAIKYFLNEKIDSPSDACDDYSAEWRLLEKIKEGYYCKKRLRKLYDSEGDD